MRRCRCDHAGARQRRHGRLAWQRQLGDARPVHRRSACAPDPGRSARARAASLQDRSMTPEEILVELPELEPEIIGWRRHIHERPELSFEEHETARFVEWKLQRWGLEPERPTPTSVVARLQGDLPGP